MLFSVSYLACCWSFSKVTEISGTTTSETDQQHQTILLQTKDTVELLPVQNEISLALFKSGPVLKRDLLKGSMDRRNDERTYGMSVLYKTLL